MKNLPFVLGLSFLLAIFGLSSAAPPIYEVHDYVSAELQKRRTLGVNEKCDADFGVQLESLVTEIEKNKDASEQVAAKLKQDFVQYLEKRPEGYLCASGSWCEAGVCKKREAPVAVPAGRSMQRGGGGDSGQTKEPEPAPAEEDEPAPEPPKQPAFEPLPREVKPAQDSGKEKSDDDEDNESEPPKNSTESTTGTGSAVQVSLCLTLGSVAMLLLRNFL